MSVSSQDLVHEACDNVLSTPSGGENPCHKGICMRGGHSTGTSSHCTSSEISSLKSSATTVPIRLTHSRKDYPLNKVRQVEDERQLLMRVGTVDVEGSQRFLKILVDTGAEVNLVRTGLIPSHCFFPSKEPSNAAKSKWSSNGRRPTGSQAQILA